MILKSSYKIGTVFYAVALIAWGSQHFLLHDFVAGRPPAWPGVAGKDIFAYCSGLLLIVTGVAAIARVKVAALLLALSGFMVLLWAGTQNVFLLLTTLDYGALLTSTNKSLTIGFGAILMASVLNANKDHTTQTNVDRSVEKLAPLAQYFTGFFLLASGVQHFLFADFVKFLIPGWIPGEVFWTYFSAVALIAAGLGLITGVKAMLAATLSSYMIFVWVLLLHLPRALGTDGNANEWTAVFEALAVSGILFTISIQLRGVHEAQELIVKKSF
jgi:uncharacterized membrane protein